MFDQASALADIDQEGLVDRGNPPLGPLLYRPADMAPLRLRLY